MTLPKIALFAILLFLLQVTAGALITLVFGVPITSGQLLAQYSTSIVVSTCVFAYMSWTHPTRPYLFAFIVGISAGLLSVLASAPVIGEMFWDLSLLLFDIPALLAAIFLSVSLGTKCNQRSFE
jgi:hypothetical protein